MQLFSICDTDNVNWMLWNLPLNSIYILFLGFHSLGPPILLKKKNLFQNFNKCFIDVDMWNWRTFIKAIFLWL